MTWNFCETFIFLMIFLRCFDILEVQFWFEFEESNLLCITFNNNLVYINGQIGDHYYHFQLTFFKTNDNVKSVGKNVSWISLSIWNKEHFYFFTIFRKINVKATDKVDKTPCQPAYLKADHCLREKKKEVLNALKGRKLGLFCILISILMFKIHQKYQKCFLVFILN